MKKNIFYFVLCILISFSSFAQIKYEKGYIVNDKGEKISVLIKNKAWRYTPEKISYKFSENSPEKNGTKQNIRAFGLHNGVRYVRAKVKIDYSSNEISKLSKIRRPEFKEKTVFLKILIKGKASLYAYYTSRNREFFYGSDSGKISPLIYKKYVTKKLAIRTNNRFRQQLLINLSCKNIPEKAFKNIDYTEKDLSKIFVKYNQCQNADYIKFNKKIKYDFFKLSIRPGIVNTSLDFMGHLLGFKNQLTYRIGLEAEFILPFNKNKWAVTVEPTYVFPYEQSFSYKNHLGKERPHKIMYKALNIPVGVRYSLFLGPDSKLYINGMAILNFTFDSNITNVFYNNEIPTSSGGLFLGAGIGYKYKKYSVEFRSHFKRTLVDIYYASSSYKTFSFIVGYTLF